jgi:hypothetical protein
VVPINGIRAAKNGVGALFLQLVRRPGNQKLH